MISRRFTVFVAASFLFAGAALGQDFLVDDLVITHPWARATATPSVPSAGYLVIENTGTEGDRLLGANSSAAARVELHRTVIEDGIARMRPAPDGVILPADAIVELAPGGYHFMLMGLALPLAAGTRVPLTLRFERAGEVEVELAVE
jgi:copper(I)-binding protein